MGSDNLASLHKWKNYELILRDYDLYVYRRPDAPPADLEQHPRVHLCDAPMMYLSASYIRDCIKAGKSVQYLVPEAGYDYLEGSGMYR